MYAFGEKIQKKVISDSLRRGIDGHYLMEVFFKAYAATGSWEAGLQALASEYQNNIANIRDDEKLGEIIKLHGLVVGFLDYYRSRIVEWDIQFVEHEFQVEAEPGVKFGFRPDLVIKLGGYYQPIDWKFTQDFYTPSSMALLPQLPKYMWALREMDMPVKQGQYGFIRYRSMKNNEPSNLYRLGMPPVLFNRERDKRTYDEWIEVAYEINTLKEMHNLKVWEKESKRVGNNLVCRSCSFKELCAAELSGGTGDNIRREMYEPSTYGYTERTS
jgi:hypothetical protein